MLSALLQALLVVAPLTAQEASNTGVPADIDLVADPLVLLLSVPVVAEAQNTLVESIVADAMELELQRQGVAVVSVDRAAVGGALPTDFADSALADAAEQMGAAAGAGFVVAVVYELAGREVTLDSGWLNRLDGVVTAAGQRQGAIDLGFDSMAVDIVNQFLRQAAPSIARFGAQPDSVPATTSVAAADVGGTEGAGPADGAVAGASGAAAPGVAEPELPLAIPRQPLQIGTLVSALVPADVAATDFGLGVVPSLYLSWEYPLAGGILGLGLAVPVQVFRASGLFAQAWGTITAAAAEARYAIPGPGGLSFYARVQAGPALFVLSLDFDPPAIKTAPYVAAGGGGGFALGEALAVGLDVGYAATWDIDDEDPDQTIVLGGLTAGLFVSVTF